MKSHQSVVEMLAREAKHAPAAQDAPGVTEAVKRIRAGAPGPEDDDTVEARYAYGLALTGLGEVDLGVEAITDALEAPKVKAKRRKAAKEAAESPVRGGAHREVPALRKSGDQDDSMKAPRARPLSAPKRMTTRRKPKATQAPAAAQAPEEAAQKTAPTKQAAKKKATKKATAKKATAKKATKKAPKKAGTKKTVAKKKATKKAAKKAPKKATRKAAKSTPKGRSA